MRFCGHIATLVAGDYVFSFIYHIADVILVIGLYLSALPVWENANIFLMLVPTSPFHCL